MSRPRSARCGTPSGWSRHKLDDEKPCDACALAKARYDKRSRAAPDKVRVARLRTRAQGRALGALRANYPDEYQRLYQAHLAEIFRAEGVNVPNAKADTPAA